MTGWSEIAAAEPEFAGRVQRLFDAYTNKTIATLRRDGSPRISAIEAQFTDGDLRVGMMIDSVKAADVLRDSRIALHSPSPDPPGGDHSGWAGDAKLAGRAVQITDPALVATLPQAGHLFRIDVTEVVLTRLGDPADHLVIESWHPGRGLERRTRK